MYFLTGPIVTWFYEDVICMVYNKQVAEDLGIRNGHSTRCLR